MAAISYTSLELKGVNNSFQFILDFPSDSAGIGSITLKTDNIVKRIFISTAKPGKETQFLRELALLAPDRVKKLSWEISKPKDFSDRALWRMDQIQNLMMEDATTAEDPLVRAYFFHRSIDKRSLEILHQDRLLSSEQMAEIRERNSSSYRVNPEARDDLLPPPKESLSLEEGLAHPDPKVRAYFLPQKIHEEMEKQGVMKMDRNPLTIREEIQSQLETQYQVPHDTLSLTIPLPKSTTFKVDSLSLEKLRQKITSLRENRIPYEDFIHLLFLKSKVLL